MKVTSKISWWQVLLAAAVAVAGLVGWWAVPAESQPAAPLPVGSFAFVARADNPVDALAAGSVAGQLGAPVYLTGTASLDGHARQGLVDTAPDVVVLAGGTAALSAAVETEIGQLLPDAQVRRFAGAGRTETARLVNELTGELGVVRPVVAGATVAGDVGIDGSLSVAGVDVSGALAAMAARIDELEAAGGGSGDDSRIAAVEQELATARDRIEVLETDLASAEGQIAKLQDDVAANQGRVGALESTLAGVSREGDTLVLSGMNVQVVNGLDNTETSNGLGNVIVGYNAQSTTPATRTGSHYLVVGDEHEWTEYGGIIAGIRNTASGLYASVSGGIQNTASGPYASVSGGFGNTASGERASASGGQANTASGIFASVSGGFDNSASASAASVSGGQLNTASGRRASVSGGESNTASANSASVSGGWDNTANGVRASVSGGQANTASGDRASVSGGFINLADGLVSWVSGGTANTASGDSASVSGGEGNTASGAGASVSGGRANAADDRFGSVAGGNQGSELDDYDTRVGDTNFSDVGP